MARILSLNFTSEYSVFEKRVVAKVEGADVGGCWVVIPFQALLFTVSENVCVKGVDTPETPMPWSSICAEVTIALSGKLRFISLL